MAKDSLRKIVSEIFSLADVQVGGERDQDITVINSDFYKRVLAKGSLALGESYMDGWWRCKKIDQLITNILTSGLEKRVKTNPKVIFSTIRSRLFNLQKVARAYEVAKKHYDIGNALFREMLDKKMVYSCAYWKGAKNLDEAQAAKLDLVCRKIGLQPGMSVLDIGCGWGSFAEFAAKKYQVKVTGITVSREQVKWANAICRGLPVEIRLQDYRCVNETFDRVVSIGMFEHVGFKNYKAYMTVVRNVLNKGGLFFLQTIGKKERQRTTDPWINRYIFPNGYLPSPREITTAADGLFILEGWENFGADYDKTLMAWYHNFVNGWDRIKHYYDNRFRRMWEYYLLACAGGFRARDLQLWQIVFSKN